MNKFKTPLEMDLQFFAENSDESAGHEDDQQKDVKTFTEEDVNRLIAQNKSKAKEEAKKNFEAELNDLKEQYETQLAEATSKLDDKSKEEFDLSKAKREIEKLKEQLAAESNEKQSLQSQIQMATMRDRAIETLNEKQLPVNEKVLAFVVKDNADDTLQAIDDFSELLSAERNKYASSNAPNTSGGAKSNKHSSIESILDGAKQTPL